jgi:hypothetical protein
MTPVSQSGSGSGVANDQGEAFKIQSRGLSISAKGMYSQFEGLYFARFPIVPSHISSFVRLFLFRPARYFVLR